MTEPFSARCRRVLENGPVSPDDHEAARYLIEQGLADGRCGPPSKGRDNYGKITQVAWFGITPAGRLWLEQLSAGAELDEAEKLKYREANHDAEQLKQKSLEPIAEAIARLPKPPSNLVTIALGVVVAILGAMVLLLFRTHLDIPL